MVWNMRMGWGMGLVMPLDRGPPTRMVWVLGVCPVGGLLVEFILMGCVVHFLVMVPETRMARAMVNSVWSLPGGMVDDDDDDFD